MSRNALSIVLLAFVALAFSLHAWPRLDATGLIHSDEVLAGERAREILVRKDPGRITLNFVPDYHKPPLQYWMSATLLATLDSPEQAVRLPALLYACGSILLLGLAAGRFCPQHPFVIPLAGLLLATSLAFGFYAGIGILECGQLFHILLVLLGLPCAGHAARWWLVAAGSALGALQKLPVGFILWLVFVIVDAARTRTFTLARASIRPAAVALLVAASWPLLQLIRDPAGLLGTYRAELANLSGIPDHPLSEWWQYLHGLWLSSPLITAGSIIGIALLIARPGLRRLAGLPEISIFAALWLTGISIAHIKHPHYMLTALPFLSLLAIVPLASCLPKLATIRLGFGIAMAIASVSFVATHPVPQHLSLAEQQVIVNELEENHQVDESLVLVGFDAHTPYQDKVTTEYLLFYSESTSEVEQVSIEHVDELLDDPTISRGIAGQKHFEEMAAMSPRFKAVDETRRFVHWVELPVSPSNKPPREAMTGHGNS